MITITIETVLQGLFLGVLMAVLAVGYNKLVIGKFVKALISAKAVHPAFAKSFEDLNVKKNFFITYALRNRGILRKMVFERDDRPDGKNGYYYIPEDKLYRAGRMYAGKDVDLLMIAAIIIICFIFFAVLLLYLPSLMNYVTDIFGDISGNANK